MLAGFAVIFRGNRSFKETGVGGGRDVGGDNGEEVAKSGKGLVSDGEDVARQVE